MIVYTTIVDLDLYRAAHQEQFCLHCIDYVNIIMFSISGEGGGGLGSFSLSAWNNVKP